MFWRDDSAKRMTKDEALSRLWDAMQESGVLGSTEIDADDVETITQVHGAEDVPSPDEQLISEMWMSVVIEIERAELASPSLSHSNGLYYDVSIDSIVAPEVVPRSAQPAGSTRVADAVRAGQLGIRAVFIAVVSGFVAGFLALGLGGRVIMRIAAMLSSSELQGTLTEGEERVGEITIAGSLNLMFTGGIIGISLGLGFLAIKSYLPASGWRRMAVASFVFFAVCGFVVLEGGENRDYERFGIAGLNVCLFTLLPVFFGLLIVPINDWLDRRVGRNLPRLSRSPRAIVVSLEMLCSVVVAVPALLFLLVMPPLQLFFLTPVLVWMSRRVSRRGNMGFTLRTADWMPRAALALPCLVGLALTAIAIGRIM